MAICGAPSLVRHHTDWGAWLAIALALLCLSSIARNYRGPGTRMAVLIAFIGILFLLFGLFTPDSLPSYYLGGSLLFLSSFYNGRGYQWLRRIL